jgi:hypothetical protein
MSRSFAACHSTAAAFDGAEAPTPVTLSIATRAGAYAGLGSTAWLTRVAGGLVVAAGARLAIARTV